MTQLSLERIPRHIIVAAAILISASAITLAAAPCRDSIKSGFEYCENTVQKFGPTVIQWALKVKDGYDKGKIAEDVFHGAGRAARWAWKNWHQIPYKSHPI